MAGRGKKENNRKNYQAHKERMLGKKLERKKQRWVPIAGDRPGQPEGYWEKVQA